MLRKHETQKLHAYKDSIEKLALGLKKTLSLHLMYFLHKVLTQQVHVFAYKDPALA